ncbi:MAG: response regulator [Bacteroidia bacterium]
MKPVSIFIVEDKMVISENIETMLLHAGFAIAGKAAKGEVAAEKILSVKPDIVLMDIQLAGKMDGIDTAIQINSQVSIPIIYLTDHSDEKTFERAKKTNPAAYLLKPFSARELSIAIELAFYNASKGLTAAIGPNKTIMETSFVFKDRLFLKDTEGIFRIDIDDIFWIEAGGSYCDVHTTKKKYTRTVSLKSFLEDFSHPLLVRIHRSYAVNIDKVIAINGNMLTIDDGKNTAIQIGDNYKVEVHKLFKII